MQTSRSQKSFPPLIDPPPVSPALLSTLKCLPPRSGCRSSTRTRHKGLLVGLQPGERGEHRGVTHALAISFVHPAPARGCGWERGLGAGGEGARGAAERFHVGRGFPAREAGPRAQPSWISCGATGSQPGFFRAQSKVPALGDACGPQQALLCCWCPPRACPCGKVKINHGREGLARLAARSGGSQVPAPESHQQLPKGCLGDMSASHLHPATCQGDDAWVPAQSSECTSLMSDGLPGSREIVCLSIC